MDRGTTSGRRRVGATVPVVAGEQSGVFSREQCRAEGWSDGQVRRRLTSGQWRRVAGRALAAHDAVVSPMGMAWAAWLTWPGCVVGHTTAAHLYGWPVAGDDRVHVVSSVRRSAVSGIVVHRGAVGAGDVLPVADGVLVTAPARTAVDCLAQLPFEDAYRLWAFVSTHSVITRPQLAAAARERLGLKGTPALLTLLRHTSSGAASEAERRFHLLLHGAAVQGWTPNVAVHDDDGVIGVVDVLFERERVVVEIDGWSTHRDQDSFVRDRRRQNRLVAAGYTVLRLTWEDIVAQGPRVLTELSSVLAARRS